VNAEKLVRMVNQVAAFFASQPEGERETGVAEHVRSFWTPAMRRDVYAHLDAGGAGLDPLAARALAALRRNDGAARAD
jgi:formate dehydrogenase subunit delta